MANDPTQIYVTKKDGKYTVLLVPGAHMDAEAGAHGDQLLGVHGDAEAFSAPVGAGVHGDQPLGVHGNVEAFSAPVEGGVHGDADAFSAPLNEVPGSLLGAHLLAGAHLVAGAHAIAGAHLLAGSQEFTVALDQPKSVKSLKIQVDEQGNVGVLLVE